jgi:hypothetical protein
VGEWAYGDKYKERSDYPFRSQKFSAFPLGLAGCIRTDRGADLFFDNKPWNTEPPCLWVRDLKERMPLWEAFVARHNAEEAATSK